MAPSVLLTRTRPVRLAAALAERGVEAWLSPALVTRETGEPPPDGAPDGVVITSARAASTPGLGPALGGAPVFVVGERTAEALGGAGVVPVHVGEQGGAAVIAAARALLGESRRLWFVGARQPASPTLEALARWPGAVEHWAVYETVATDELERLGQLCVQVDLVEVSSPKAAAVVAVVAREGQRVVAIGETTATAARALGLEVVAVSPSPETEAFADTIAAALTPGTASG